MAETGENTSVVKEKNQKKKLTVIIAAALVCFIAIFAAVKVYTSPAGRLQRQLDLGNRYLEEMDYEQAIVAFDKAIEIDPKNVDAYLGKADAYVGLGDSAMAIEALEAGYQAAEENEAIKGRLLAVYAAMLEDAIERGSYEDGMKTYECIVELDGEDEELRNRLEALWDHGSGEEETSDETAEGERDLPYFKLGFSPEDFTFAGYSVMDGDHFDDVEAAAAEMLPNIDSVVGTGYLGWSYSRETDTNVSLLYSDENFDYIRPGAYYSSNDAYIRISVSNDIGRWPIPDTEWPLYEGKVIPNVTSCEEALESLGIRQLFQALEEKEDGDNLEFESQYGTGKCYESDWTYENNIVSHGYRIQFYGGEREWEFQIYFVDDILCDVDVRVDL